MKASSLLLTFTVAFGLIFGCMQSIQSSEVQKEVMGFPAGWSDDINISDNSTIDEYPSLAAFGDDVHIVWRNVWFGDTSLYYRNSNDAGMTWNDRVCIVPVSPMLPAFPDIGVNDSSIHIVYRMWETGSWEINYINSTDGGETWNPSKLISVDDEFNSEGPIIAINNSNIHAIWVDSRHGAESVPANTEIYYNWSYDGGITWGTEKRLTNALYSSAPGGLAINNSNLHLIMIDDRTGDFEVYYKMSKDNGLTWEDGQGNIDQDRKLTTNTTDHHNPIIAVAESNIYVAWFDEELPGPNYRIYYVNSSNNGETWSSPKLLLNSVTASTSDIVAYNDTVEIIFNDWRVGNEGVYIINSTDGGVSWNPEVQLTVYNGLGEAKICVNNSIKHLVRTEGGAGVEEIYYKKYPGISLADTEPPLINHTPVPSANISQLINITANITDDTGVDAVYLNYTGVNATNYNVSMNQWNGNWSYDIPAQNNIGTVDYFIWCNDTSGNDNQTIVYQIQINDIADPEINHLPVASANVFNLINITANITDDVSVNLVFLNYTGINGTNYNVSMQKWGGNWNYEIPAQDVNGTVYYFIWANDTSGNDNMTQVYPIPILDNVNPVADAGLDQSVSEDDVVNFDASGSTDNSGVIEYYNWSFGDGSFDSGTNITPTHVYTNAGMYIITLNVSDAAGNWDTDTCLVFVNNVGPNADAGSNQVVDEGEEVEFNASDSTDTPSDQSNLIYTWYFGDGKTGTGINVTHVYGDDGIYNATLIVTDDNGFVDSNITTITVNNVAPTIEPVPVQIIEEDSLFTLKINASDVPADTLTFSDNATLFDIDPITGMIEFTPTNDDVGNHSVNITVVDDDGGVGYIILNITVENTNDQPVIESIGQQSVVEDEEFTLNVNANDVDTGDVLTYSLITYPSGMSIDDTGLISWAPTNADVGGHTVIVKVEDTGSIYDTQSFTIIVSNVNDTPTIITSNLADATEDAFYMSYILADDIDAGDVLIYSLDTYPAFLSINPLTGQIFGTPTNDDVGTHNVVVNVTDGSDYATKTFTLNVVNVNDVPLIASTPILTADVNDLYLYDVMAVDEDNDALTYSLVEGPDGMVINGTKIIWTPTNEHEGKTYQVVIEVTDGEASTTQSFVVSVGEIPEGTNIWLPLLLGLVGGLISGVIITWIMNQRKKEEEEIEEIEKQE